METFLDEIWTATHYHVKRRDAGYFDGLLHAPSAIEDLLRLFRHEPSAVRLIRGNDKKTGPASYRLADGSLDLAGIRNDFADGFTIAVDGLERHVPAIASLAQSIETELNFPVQVNTYVTPPGSRGLVPHYDPHDVLVLQVQGSKIWHLYSGVDIPPHAMQRGDKAVPADGLPLPTDLRMEVGDVLYLPRGLVHAADTDAEPSIHLTVGVHAPTALTLAVWALQALSFRDDRLNAQLPPRYLDEHLDPDLQASLGVLLRDVIGAIEDPKAVAGGLAGLADVLVRRGRCPPLGPLSDATPVDGHTRVKKRRPLDSRVKALADGVELEFASSSVRTGADHEAALLFVSNGSDPFRVGELPGLPPQQQIELARKLIASGFLVRLPDDRSRRAAPSMKLADLARWTPIKVDLSGPTPAVYWADLSAERFAEPFFDQTVARWASGPGNRPLVKTGLEALAALDNEPSLEPAGMIFHLSRCGSTLVSRLLGTLAGVVAVAEPAPLNMLLELDAARVDEAALVRIVRLLVRALGRCRLGDERRLVLKCTSWNIRRRDVLAAAFPDTPWVWVQRDPVQVLASLLADPPGWLGLQTDPPRAARRFGLDPDEVPAMAQAEFAARALGAMLEAAAADPARRLCVDYPDLPAAAWTRVAPHFGFETDATAVERMVEESRFYSKGSAPRVFAGDVPEHRPITDEMRAAAQRFAEPGYSALGLMP